ncbi:RNase H domain-containing protein [Trichonephila clavipes]|nr:RNase H domain-containing protein [Trichonephila clavipes]
MMRQLSLELINNILSLFLLLYTDGSKSNPGRNSSGVCAVAENGLVFSCRFRSLGKCSFLRSELLTIRECPFNSRLVCWKSSWPITTLSGYKIRTNYIGQAAWWSYQELEIRRQENDFFILPLLCVASPSQVLDCICASVGQLWSEEKYGLVELKERDNIMALI